MGKTVVITGATGFIAGHFSRRMTAEGWEVYGVERPGAAARPPYRKIFPVSLGESIAGVLARTRPDAILHTALDGAPNRYEIMERACEADPGISSSPNHTRSGR